MKFEKSEMDTVVPTKMIGPIKLVYNGGVEELCHVPLATFETPLWYSTKRGALVSEKTSGIYVNVIDDIMTRSVIFEANNLAEALDCKLWIENNQLLIAKAAESTSKFVEFKSIFIENVGKLLYIRLGFNTGNASGHNMVTNAADSIVDCIILYNKGMKYVSVSGNYCVDKKVSSINGILGRGKRVSAEMIVPCNVCESILKTTPQKIVDLNIKKNLVGSVLSGGVRTANSHYSNVVLAMYLATGQDAANLVEASQGITFAEICNGNNGDLYFSVNLPNIIVGTVGNGKKMPFAVDNLQKMGCYPSDPDSAKRLAALIASAVLCSELSLMSALSNKGELMDAHIKLERK